MCKVYTCIICNEPDWDRCDSALEISLHGARCENLLPTTRRKKCTTCKQVERVIEKLNKLVWKEPWRLNKGREQQDWEKDLGMDKQEEQDWEKDLGMDKQGDKQDDGRSDSDSSTKLPEGDSTQCNGSASG